MSFTRKIKSFGFASSKYILDTINDYQTIEEAVLIYWYGGPNLNVNTLHDGNCDRVTQTTERTVHLKMQELKMTRIYQSSL